MMESSKKKDFKACLYTLTEGTLETSKQKFKGPLHVLSPVSLKVLYRMRLA